MESNSMAGGVYSNVPPSMLGLEMSLHHPLQSQNPHHPMAAYAPHDGGDYHLQPQQSAKQGYPKSKNQSLTLSDDDEPGFTAENSADDGKRKMSPWQRMKWTDNMVRLLIMVVYYIGDEVGGDAANEPSGGGKKKGGGVLQKKGKWKSVSRAMMERGFYVSPQQCEDKFNDLNKRYKRVNDILGKGTSCRVVENQSLLDSMDHLSPKMKEEVKKLLNSKHLFFREMCAYHNSCGHGNGGVALPEPPQAQQRCLHAAEKAPAMPNLNNEEEDEEEDEEEEDNDDEDDEEDEDNDDGASNVSSRKRMRRGGDESTTPLVRQLEGEIVSVMRDGGKSGAEKRQWMRAKMMALEEQHVGIQAQSFELEKQRLKWLKFSSKKEREMEREKLANERMKLENERMVLLIRQKELDLMELHQQQHSSNKRGDPSSITG